MEKSDEKSELQSLKDISFFEIKGTFIAKCVHCYDGDTVHCIFKFRGEYNKFKIRMYGYDSPEMKPLKKNYTENERLEIKKKALEAKDFISNLILNKIVYLTISSDTRKPEKYGRHLGTIYLKEGDKKSVNDMMIENEHGYAYFGGTKKTTVSYSEPIKEVNEPLIVKGKRGRAKSDIK